MMEPVVITGKAVLPQNLPNHGEVFVLPKIMLKLFQTISCIRLYEIIT